MHGILSAMHYAKERLTKYKNVLFRYLAIRILNIPSFGRQIILDLLWIYANSECNYGFTLRVVFWKLCQKWGQFGTIFKYDMITKCYRYKFYDILTLLTSTEKTVDSSGISTRNGHFEFCYDGQPRSQNLLSLFINCSGVQLINNRNPLDQSECSIFFSCINNKTYIYICIFFYIYMHFLKPNVQFKKFIKRVYFLQINVNDKVHR